MSLLRAATQILRHRKRLKKRLASMGEEKAVMIEAVNAKYADRERQHIEELENMERALLALGFSLEAIASLARKVEDAPEPADEREEDEAEAEELGARGAS